MDCHCNSPRRGTNAVADDCSHWLRFCQVCFALTSHPLRLRRAGSGSLICGISVVLV